MLTYNKFVYFRRLNFPQSLAKRALSKKNDSDTSKESRNLGLTKSPDDFRYNEKTERMMSEYGEYLKEMRRNSPLNNILPDDYTPPTVEELKWRTPWTARKDREHSFLEVFDTGNKERSKIMKFIQSDIDLSPAGIKNHLQNFRLKYEYHDQLFNSTRHETLGNELAAAHFVVARGGKVKFVGHSKWEKQDKYYDHELPGLYDPAYVLEAIDCEGMVLYYEGLENLKGLKRVKSLSVKGCKRMDDWCVDRISGQMYKSLEELDLRDCPNITFRGLEALHKMHRLKVLKLNAPQSKRFELNCLLLEEVLPGVVIEFTEPKLEQLDDGSTKTLQLPML